MNDTKLNSETEEDFYERVEQQHDFKSGWEMPGVTNFNDVAYAAGPICLRYNSAEIQLPQRDLTWMDLWIASEAAMAMNINMQGIDEKDAYGVVHGFALNGGVLELNDESSINRLKNTLMQRFIAARQELENDFDTDDDNDN